MPTVTLTVGFFFGRVTQLPLNQPISGRPRHHAGAYALDRLVMSFLLCGPRPPRRSQMTARFAKTPQPGEIWVARFPFEEKGQYKARPVFVLTVHAWGIQVAYISTKKVDETSSRTDVLLDLDEARSVGLLCAGRIDFGRRATISIMDVGKKIGDVGMPGEKLSMLKFREMAEAAHAAGL